MRSSERSPVYNRVFPLLIRIGLGTMWLYAGVVEKLLDPGYLNPSSKSYVGITIEILMGSPIMRGFLEAVVFPHVYLVGLLVMIGEISIGTLTLLGVLSRFTNTVAFYTNLIYFLSAYWVDAEEYGLNLLMMVLDLYIVFNGPSSPSVDSLISKAWKRVDDWKLWFAAGSVLYIFVILFIYFV